MVCPAEVGGARLKGDKVIGRDRRVRIRAAIARSAAPAGGPADQGRPPRNQVADEYLGAPQGPVRPVAGLWHQIGGVGGERDPAAITRNRRAATKPRVVVGRGPQRSARTADERRRVRAHVAEINLRELGVAIDPLRPRTRSQIARPRDEGRQPPVRQQRWDIRTAVALGPRLPRWPGSPASYPQAPPTQPAPTTRPAPPRPRGKHCAVTRSSTANPIRTARQSS